MAQTRVFDPDLEVHIPPADLTWPLYGRVHVEYLSLSLQAQLGEVINAGHTLPYVLFTEYRKNGSFCEACVFGTAADMPKVWIPWPMISVDINIHPN